MANCSICGTELYHIDEACPNCLAGSRLVERPPTTREHAISETWKARFEAADERSAKAEEEIAALRTELAERTASYRAMADSEADLRKQLASANESAAQQSRNADYYRGLVVQIGKLFGKEALIADDGSVMEDVLCAKVPELVASALSREKAAEGRCGELEKATIILCDKLDAIHKNDKYLAVWSIAQNHQGPYDGPNYVDELTELRRLVGWVVGPCIVKPTPDYE